jgi:hypothetical protein
VPPHGGLAFRRPLLYLARFGQAAPAAPKPDSLRRAAPGNTPGAGIQHGQKRLQHGRQGRFQRQPGAGPWMRDYYPASVQEHVL